MKGDPRQLRRLVPLCRGSPTFIVRVAQSISARKPLASTILSVPILAYHHIAAPPPGSTSAATYLAPARFARQVGLLKRLGYRSVSVANLGRALRGEMRLPSRSVVFTFDDGWLDVYTDAFPILGAAGFTGTVFLVGNALGQRGIAFAESREKAPQHVMAPDQIADLAAKGWEIGAHSNSHVHLTRLSKAEAMRDIMMGREAVESRIGVRPDIFCYPYGDCHAGLAATVEDLGFEAACSTIPGRRHHPDDRFFLRRVPIGHEMSIGRFFYCFFFRGYKKGEQTLRKAQSRGWESTGAASR